ncbi:UNVERIFIED_CONTAM: hypothetical protein PYX00_007955 [Menopon gallinae]|uniref:Adenosine 5'-monophosphoramidase HINT3 n=1 Tax=Menopon gallinae TaxID=328185 RepID=A0AAW2HLA2_9NEOP
MAPRVCVFCGIIDKSIESKILFEDHELLAFPDIKPAAKHHYLVVPKRHIKDVRELNKDNIPLLQRMIELGHKVLEEQGADIRDSRFGFHWPPFHSISHLHLHAISPASSMSYISKLVFKPNTLWFVDVS